jgi:hypothetical protein
MNRVISEKYILQYLAISVAFYFLFEGVSSYYIANQLISPHPIDSHLLYSLRFFDSQYVVLAKNGGYNIPNFFKSFFVIDLIFPLVYTLLFLSIAQLTKLSRYYEILFYLILIGILLDYTENLSFAVFLKLNGDRFAAVIAFFTTLKSIVFSLNLIASSLVLIFFARQRVIR